VVSVPVVAPDHWMKETDPAPLRFMSEIEEANEPESSSETLASYVPQSEQVTENTETQIPDVAPTLHEAEFVTEYVSAPPRFAELAEAPAYAPLPRDYPADMRAFSGATEAGRNSNASSTVFSQTTEDHEQQDLDVPAFLRRGHF